MTEVSHPKRCTQPFYPCAPSVNDDVGGQRQRFAMIRQYHHDRVLVALLCAPYIET